jgi:hypothetical protein
VIAAGGATRAGGAECTGGAGDAGGRAGVTVRAAGAGGGATDAAGATNGATGVVGATGFSDTGFGAGAHGFDGTAASLPAWVSASRDIESSIGVTNARRVRRRAGVTESAIGPISSVPGCVSSSLENVGGGSLARPERPGRAAISGSVVSSGAIRNGGTAAGFFAAGGGGTGSACAGLAEAGFG